MKTAGIVTYFSNDNYGTVLQNYAVQTVLKKYNIEPCTIRYDIFRNFSQFEIFKIYVRENGLIEGFLNLIEKPYRRYIARKDYNRKFELFRKNYINYTDKIFFSKKDLIQRSPSFDLYVSGSDQIFRVQDLANEYAELEAGIAFLDFVVPEKEKISFAASFGLDKFSSPYKEEVKNFLSVYKLITLREKSGVKICNELGIASAYHQLDPTLLLSAQEYRQLYRENYFEKPKKKYVLLYLLNESTPFSIHKLYRWAERKGYEVVYVNGNTNQYKFNFRKKTMATIPQWLYLIDNAECVFTNSFHGAVFSSIFNKRYKFVCKKLGKEERIKSLFKSLMLEDMFFDGDFSKVLLPIDYVKMNKFLETYKIESPVSLWLKKYSEEI